jgi:hypothetical protein
LQIANINSAIRTLTSTQDLEAIEQLAFYIVIRYQISKENDIPIERIVKETQLIQFVKLALQSHQSFMAQQEFSSVSQDLLTLSYFCGIELTWILCNLSTSSDLNVIAALLEPSQSASSYGSSIPDSPIALHIKHYLFSEDMQLVDQVLWLIGNLTAMPNGQVRVLVTELGLIERFSTLCDLEQLPADILSNMAWSLRNMAD